MDARADRAGAPPAPETMAEFVDLLERCAPREGPTETPIEGVFAFRDSRPRRRAPTVYPSGLIILGRGRKRGWVGGRCYDFSAGSYLTLFLPMPLETETIAASPDRPLLGVAIEVDLNTIAETLLRLDRIGSPVPQPRGESPTGIYAAPLGRALLDPVVRLLRLLADPVDAAMLGPGLLEEIHYRLLRDRHAGALEARLRQQGQVQQIARAVDHINRNLSESVAVDELAALVNMSTSAFHKRFREVMHVSPLQYAKSMKLFRAQALIREGRRVSEAGYLVGYNSPAQFSREYKRHFGFAPSET